MKCFTKISHQFYTEVNIVFKYINVWLINLWMAASSIHVNSTQILCNE